jgi:hypothetical protein
MTVHNDSTSPESGKLQNWFAGATAAELDNASQAILALQDEMAQARAADARRAAQVVAHLNGGRDATR